MPMARIAIVGIGRVGLATGVALATKGHDVVGYDCDAARVKTINSGSQPYYERGLTGAFGRVTKAGKLSIIGEPKKALDRAKYIFVCVGTPPMTDGSMDSSYLRNASRLIGKAIGGRKDFPVIVVKSTVVPGSTEGIVLPAITEESDLPSAAFGLCVNPEFLKEGSMMEDSLKPDRIVIGSRDKRSGDLLQRVYSGFKCRKWRCDLRTAEMVKYATNAFLATKITFANEIANICGALGLDSDKVLEGMALDPRINPRSLVPGVGFGGSCLPKDVKAVVSASKQRGYEPPLLMRVLDFNNRQALLAVEMLQKETGELAGKRVAVLGLAFKPDTDDIRESRAIPIIEELIRRGADVVVHDPAASLSQFGLNLPVKVAKNTREALRETDGCIIQTQWSDYGKLGNSDFAVMRKAVVIDGRRTLDPRKLPKGVIYRRIG